MFIHLTVIRHGTTICLSVAKRSTSLMAYSASENPTYCYDWECARRAINQLCATGAQQVLIERSVQAPHPFPVGEMIEDEDGATLFALLDWIEERR